MAGFDNIKVKELWDPRQSYWNRPLVKHLFDNQEAALVLVMPRVIDGEEDNLV